MNDACRFFLLACLYGFGACLGYDLLRLWRRIIPHSLLFIHGEDLLFFGGCTAIFLYGVWSQAQGQLQGYYFWEWLWPASYIYGEYTLSCRNRYVFLGEFRSKYEKTVKVTGKVSENAKKSIDG